MFCINSYYNISQSYLFCCEPKVYKLSNMNSFLYFQRANFWLTTENFQEIYKAPLSYKPPSLECLKSISSPGGSIEKLQYIYNFYKQECYL